MTDETTDEKLAQMRKESVSGKGDRLESEADQPDMVDHIADALERADDGDLTKTISVWDPSMAALFDALQEDPQRFREVVADLQERTGYDVDVDEPERSDLVKVALRFALQEADPDLLDEAREAERRRTPSQF